MKNLDLLLKPTLIAIACPHIDELFTYKLCNMNFTLNIDEKNCFKIFLRKKSRLAAWLVVSFTMQH